MFAVQFGAKPQTALHMRFEHFPKLQTTPHKPQTAPTKCGAVWFIRFVPNLFVPTIQKIISLKNTSKIDNRVTVVQNLNLINLIYQN